MPSVGGGARSGLDWVGCCPCASSDHCPGGPSPRCPRGPSLRCPGTPALNAPVLPTPSIALLPFPQYPFDPSGGGNKAGVGGCRGEGGWEDFSSNRASCPRHPAMLHRDDFREQ